MQERFEFGHDDRKRIYEFIERRGAANPEELQRQLRIEPRAFRHHIAILVRDSVIEEVDGKLQVAIDGGAKEEFTTDDVEFQIRPARQADLSGIVGAIRRVVEEKSYIVAESVADEVDHQNALLRHNEVESRMFFVATVAEEVVGWVHIHGPELDKLHHTAELTVGVLEEYRRNGIGSHLLSRGVEWAASEGYEKIYQSIPSTNEQAVEFLESHGWTVEAVRDRHYKIDGEYVDEVMMAVDVIPD